jgi:uroporphyrinogen-III synthase
MRLLVTRPEPDGERTASQLRVRSCDVIVAPLLRMEPLDVDPGAGPWDALALTSANAVRAFADQAGLRALLAVPTYAVGRRTSDAARNVGFGNVAAADGDVASLIDLIKRHHGAGARVLYLAGEDRAGDLAGGLAAGGIGVTTTVVYRAKSVSGLPGAVHEALIAGRLDGVLHFSRRTTAAYVELAAAAGILDQALAPVQFCLSEQVAAPLLTAGAAKVRIAGRPREADLLDLVTIQNSGGQGGMIC